jgi:dihydroorotate dehydrogenase electron transfer subunit
LLAQAEVLDLANVGGPNFLLTLGLAAGEARLRALGRFARLRAWPAPPLGPGPLLDRPISIHRLPDRGAEFLIRKVGPGTALLSSLERGARVRLIGPLGRGLDDLDPSFSSKSWHLVAGGAGLGPMASFLEALPGRARLFYGERSGSLQVDRGFLSRLAPGAVAVTEDGSGYGRRGLVTAPLEAALGKDPRPILACGPPAMLAALARLAQKCSVPLVACAEARMGCGLGVCLSCSLPLLDGSNLRVCQQGPVIDGLAVDWGCPGD